MAQVYGAGGKTLPKRGRLGTGSYWPQGTPLFSHHGNVFPGIKVEREAFPEISFGETSRASISTIAGRSAINTQAIHPNRSFYDTGTQVLAPAAIASSAVEGTNLQPVLPRDAVLTMPHERNTNSASGTKKKGLPYRTVFGASKTMPTDSAFQKNPGAMYKHSTRKKPSPAFEAVKKEATSRTFARSANPPAASYLSLAQQHRTPPPSFVSRNNQWMDPNNSFLSGAHSAATARAGAGRWNTIKKGVV